MPILDEKGELWVRLRKLDSDADSQVTLVLEKKIVLEIGKPIQMQSIPGLDLLIDFDVISGKTYVLETFSYNDTDTYLELISPKGDIIGEDDDGGINGGDSRLEWTADESGMYQLDITDLSGDVGKFDLTLTELQ